MAYYEIIESFGAIGNISDIGFLVLISTAMRIFNSVPIVLCIISLITNGCVLISLWRMRDQSSFTSAFCCYFACSYFQTFSGVRQWLSISIVWIALAILWTERKMLKPILLILLASSFHVSAVIAIAAVGAVYLIDNVNLRKDVTKLIVLFGATIVPVVLVGVYYRDEIFYKIKKYLPELILNDIDLGLLQPLKLLIWLAVFAVFIYTAPHYYRNSLEMKCVQEVNNIKLSRKMFAGLLLFEFAYIIFGFVSYASTTLSRVGWYIEIFDLIFYSKILVSHRSIMRLIKIPAVLVLLTIALGFVLSPDFFYIT